MAFSNFSALLDQLKIGQPRWVSASSKKEITRFTDRVGYPVLVRPSYVLSGAAMRVAHDRATLETCLAEASDVSTEHPIVISEFLTGAREIELDGVAHEGEIRVSITSEHVENAGVHSGDATIVIPAQTLYVETVRRVRAAAREIAKELKLNGPFNMQFLAKNNEIKVIECNARASRSFPFASKVLGINLAQLATQVTMGQDIGTLNIRQREDELEHVGVKAAMFSFKRLAGADPILGVEMASTGEVGCIAHDFDEALILALRSAGIHPPKKGVLVSAGPEYEKLRFLPAARSIVASGIPLYATSGTYRFLKEHGIKSKKVNWPGGGKNDVIQLIRSGKVDFVINIPKNLKRGELTYGRQIRLTSTRFGLSLLTDIDQVRDFFRALASKKIETHQLRSLPPYQTL